MFLLLCLVGVFFVGGSDAVVPRMTDGDMWSHIQAVIADCDEHPYSTYYITLKNSIIMTEKYKQLEAEFSKK